MNRIILRIAIVLISFIGPLTTVVHSASILYATSPDNTEGNFSLFTVDPSNGTITEIGEFGLRMFGLAYDSDQDILYGIGNVSGASINNLFTIDRTIGTATPIGPLGSINFWGLSYDSVQGELFAANQTGLYTIDSGNGLASLVGNLNFPEPVASRELAFDPMTNTLFLSTEGVIQATGQDINGLNVVNQTTGLATFIGTYKAGGPPNLFNNVRAIVFDQSQNVLLGIDGGVTGSQQLLTIDSSTGAASVLTSLPSGRGFFGLAFAPSLTSIPEPQPIPEPSTMLLFGTAITALIGIHRRRRKRPNQNCNTQALA